MRILILICVLFVAAAVPATGQSPLSIQGVWQNTERVVPATTNPGDRVDPFGHVPVGTQATVQPGLLILTKGYYSRTTDTGVQPRPTNAYAVPGKPTLEELQARWGPFAANAGRYELSGDILTLHAFVAKEPEAQVPGGFARLRVTLEGNTLSLTPIESSAGRIVAGVTSRYVRVE